MNFKWKVHPMLLRDLSCTGVLFSFQCLTIFILVAPKVVVLLTISGL
jgi:hypothetical protein